MSGWGISPNATPLEKLKAESADMLHGLDSCGEISYGIYCELFDFYADLIERAYELGKSERSEE